MVVCKNNISVEKGFSLVELAIVIVIMGLLVAGVVGGRDMIQTAKLRGVITEVQKYKVAIDSFKETYNGIPGDLKNASEYWSLAADCSSPYTEEAGATCNGNGDGKILNHEYNTAWDQLSMAKMIPGYYTGAGTAALLGETVPESTNIDGAGFGLRYFDSAFSYTDSLGRGIPDSNNIIFGQVNGTTNYPSNSAVIAADAHYIDSKIDEGTPDFGRVIAGNGNCRVGSAPNFEYDMDNANLGCMVLFLLADQ